MLGDISSAADPLLSEPDELDPEELELELSLGIEPSETLGIEPAESAEAESADGALPSGYGALPSSFRRATFSAVALFSSTETSERMASSSALVNFAIGVSLSRSTSDP
jgi:hypothetical protein